MENSRLIDRFRTTLHNLANSNYFRITLTVVMAILLMLPFLVYDYDTIRSFIAQNRVSGVFVAMFLYVVIGLFLIPTDGLTVFILATMGVIPAFILDVLGNSAVSYIEYFIGTGLQDITQFEKKNKKLPGFLENYPIARPRYQILGRMLPAVGSKAINILCGFRRTSLRVFTWTTLFSTSWGAFLVTVGYFWAAKLIIYLDPFGIATHYTFLQTFVSQYRYAQ